VPVLFAPLRSRPFRWLLTGQAFSLVGDRLTYLALVAALAERTGHFARAGSAAALSSLALALLLPAALFSPWAAGRMDRWRRRDVMVRADVARAVLTLALAAALPLLPTSGALLLVGLGAVANVFFLPARLAIVPGLVREGEINPANALGLLSSVLATVLGTLLGGPLIAWIGVRGALAVDGLTFLVSVVTLLQLPRGEAPAAALAGPARALDKAEPGWLSPRRRLSLGASEETTRPAPQRRTPWPGAASFAQLFRSERVASAALLLWTTWIIGALLHVCGTLRVQALTPRVTDLLAPALAALGAGGAVGAAFFGARLRRGRSLAAGIGLWVAAGGIAMLAGAGNAWLLAVAGFLTGFATAPVYILADTEIMESLDDSVRGGALAARDFFCKAGFLVVALALGRWSGPGSAGTLLVAGSVGLVAMGIYYVARRPLRT
jgi:hypothetical protein